MTALFAWFGWATTWATFKKRLPALGGYLLTLAGALLQSGLLDSYVAHSDERAWLHRAAAACLTFGPGVLFFTRSVLTGSHGADYPRLLADRRGTGSRTGEMKAPEAGAGAVSAIPEGEPVRDGAVPPAPPSVPPMAPGLGVPPDAADEPPVPPPLDLGAPHGNAGRDV